MVASAARTWVEVSASALQKNLRSVQRVIGSNVAIAPVIKANAYGHGTQVCVQALKTAKIWGVCVAYGSEALELRQMGWKGRILVLSAWDKTILADLVRQRVDFVIHSFTTLREAAAVGTRLGRRANVQIKLDSGTTRIGFLPSELTQARKSFRQSKYLNVTGLFSHLANAEERSSHRTERQIQRTIDMMDVMALPSAWRHLAGTAAALRYADSRLNGIRLGIGLYGLWPSPEIDRWSRRHLPHLRFYPALAWMTRISQVKTVPSGSAIGYGSTKRVSHATKVALLPVGYADGFDRGLSNRGWVMIDGVRCPVLGRVSMNITAVDATHVRQPHRGQPVTIIGPGVTADDVADTLKTIHYEVVSRISPAIPRQLVP